MNNKNAKETVPATAPQFDINALMATAQNLISNINSEDAMKEMNVNQMFDHVTNTVFQNLEKSGKQIDPASKQQMKAMSKMMIGTMMENFESNDKNANSKVNLEIEEPDKAIETTEPRIESNTDDKIPKKVEVFEELDSDTEADELQPIADDLRYKLPVTLNELYTGNTRKLLVTRERLDKTGRKVIIEKRKIEIPITKGMKHGQEIRFNKEGNEKYGHRAGDIIITLAVNSHQKFERLGSALYFVKNIGLYESYAAANGLINIIIEHIDGSNIILNVNNGVPLHTRDGTRKVIGGGMPYMNKNTKKFEYGDLYIRFNLILPSDFEQSDDIQLIERLFPVLESESVLMRGEEHACKRHVLLEEVTPEELNKLDEDNDYDDSDSESEYDSDYDSESDNN